MVDEQTTVAELLKSARVERGLHIKTIASEICVRSSYLTAIEEADYEQLPGKTFAIGFVKAYAAVLGQDAAYVAEMFKQEYCPEIGNVQHASLMNNEKPTRKVPGWLAPFVGLVGAGVCWAVLGSGMTAGFMGANLSSNDIAVEEAQLAAVQANISAPTSENDTDVSLQSESLTVEAETIVAIGQSEEVPSLAPIETSSAFFAPAVYAVEANLQAVSGIYTLHGVEDSWVKVAHADGTEVWSGILREGQTYRPEAEGMLLLSTSNAGGVLLQVGSGEAESLGDRGAIVADYKLEDMTLLSEQEIGELTELDSD